MNRICNFGFFLAAFGISATLMSAQTTAPRKATIYVAPATGSHLGGGYVSSGAAAPNNRSTSKLGGENTALGKAVASLDAKAGTVVEGYALMPTAVSWQTKVPTDVLQKQRQKTGLTYGQLLVANSLATGSGKTFEQVLALRAKSRDWSQLAQSLRVSEKSIVARLKAADDSVTYAEARRKLRRDQSINATDFQRGGRSRDPRGGG